MYPESHEYVSDKFFVGTSLRSTFGIETAMKTYRGAGALNMLRVSVVESSNSSVRLRVEGRLTGHSVGELRESCELHALTDGMRLTLELGDVSFADADGIQLLKDLRTRGVTILNLVPYLVLQLRAAERIGVQLRNDGDGPDAG
jgi:hypothetical protein